MYHNWYINAFISKKSEIYFNNVDLKTASRDVVFLFWFCGAYASGIEQKIGGRKYAKIDWERLKHCG